MIKINNFEKFNESLDLNNLSMVKVIVEPKYNEKMIDFFKENGYHWSCRNRVDDIFDENNSTIVYFELNKVISVSRLENCVNNIYFFFENYF